MYNLPEEIRYNIKWQTIKGIIALILIVIIGFLCYFGRKDIEIKYTKESQKADFIVNGIMYNRICIDNKEFIQGGIQLSINLDFNGKPIKCKGK